MKEIVKQAQDSVDDALSLGAVIFPVSESGQPIADQLFEFTPEDYWRKKINLLWGGLTASAIYFLAMILLYL